MIRNCLILFQIVESKYTSGPNLHRRRAKGANHVPPTKGLFLVLTFASLFGNALGWASTDGDIVPDRERTLDADHHIGTLIVRAQGLASGDGNLRFVLFDSKKNFLKRPVRAEIIEINDQQGTWTLDDLPYGVYAVLVHHDTNSSGKMERHWYGKPKEPTGTSNDPPPRYGPPKFEDAKFSFDSPSLTLTVTVN